MVEESSIDELDTKINHENIVEISQSQSQQQSQSLEPQQTVQIQQQIHQPMQQSTTLSNENEGNESETKGRFKVKNV